MTSQPGTQEESLFDSWTSHLPPHQFGLDFLITNSTLNTNHGVGSVQKLHYQQTLTFATLLANYFRDDTNGNINSLAPAPMSIVGLFCNTVMRRRSELKIFFSSHQIWNWNTQQLCLKFKSSHLYTSLVFASHFFSWLLFWPKCSETIFTFICEWENSGSPDTVICYTEK